MKTTTDFAAKCRALQNLAAPQKSRTRVLAQRASLCAGVAAIMLLAGCETMKPPEFEEVKPPPPTPRGPAFSAEDHITKGVPIPGMFRVVEVLSAELLTIQGVVKGADGKLQSGTTTQTVRLAGIVAPAPGERGWEGSVKTVRNWTQFNRLNPIIEMEGDEKYPIDLDGRRMVQVYFKGTAERTKDTRYNLNRMLVRSGWAVVDLNAATSIDLQQWMNDEEYARTRNLGLRKYGVILGQRLPSESPKTAAARKLGAGSSMSVVPGNSAAATTTTTTTSRVTTTNSVTVSPGMPSSGLPAPGLPAPAMSSNGVSGAPSMAANGVSP